MRLRTRWKVAIAAILGLPLVFAVAGLSVYVFPAQGTASSADVVLILGPATGPRLERAAELKKDGVAKNLLISAFPRPGGTLSDISYCEGRNTVCETPSPATTKGEVSMLQRYALDHDVKKAIILTSMSHVERTRFILAKCYTASEVTVIGVDEPKPLWRWGQEYMYQTAAFVKAWATSCADL